MKRFTRRICIAVLLAVVGMTGLSGCKKARSAAGEKEAPVQVKTRRAVAEGVDRLYEYTAIVEADKVNNIAPLTGGRIDRIYAEVGDRVTRGMVLVQMNESSLTQAGTQLQNLKKTVARIDELYKVGGVSQSDWEAQHAALDVAQTSYDNLLENTRLLSPIDGIVTQRNYDNGDLFAGKPVLQVQQINPVKMKVNLSELLFTEVKIGQKVDIRVDSYGEEKFTGRVSLIYPTVDAVTHTFPVEIELNNRGDRVRPGMYAHVTVNFGVEHSVLVPDLAVVKQQGSGVRYVYVCKDGKVYYRPVQIGRQLDTVYQVVEGLVDGESVVISGKSKLKDGMEVQVVK